MSADSDTPMPPSIKNVLSSSRLRLLCYVRVFRVFVSRRLSVTDRQSIILFGRCRSYSEVALILTVKSASILDLTLTYR